MGKELNKIVFAKYFHKVELMYGVITPDKMNLYFEYMKSWSEWEISKTVDRILREYQYTSFPKLATFEDMRVVDERL